jgi:hypothetical protein
MLILPVNYCGKKWFDWPHPELHSMSYFTRMMKRTRRSFEITPWLPGLLQ